MDVAVILNGEININRPRDREVFNKDVSLPIGIKTIFPFVNREATFKRIRILNIRKRELTLLGHVMKKRRLGGFDTHIAG